MKTKGKRAGLTSVQLRPEIANRLGRYIQRGMSKSEIINEALRQYLIERELQEIRQKLIPLAQSKGIYTEEDVSRLLG